MFNQLLNSVQSAVAQVAVPGSGGGGAAGQIMTIGDQRVEVIKQIAEGTLLHSLTASLAINPHTSAAVVIVVVRCSGVAILVRDYHWADRYILGVCLCGA
jgi:hypothetical protein